MARGDEISEVKPDKVAALAGTVDKLLSTSGQKAAALVINPAHEHAWSDAAEAIGLTMHVDPLCPEDKLFIVGPTLLELIREAPEELKFMERRRDD